MNTQTIVFDLLKHIVPLNLVCMKNIPMYIAQQPYHTLMEPPRAKMRPRCQNNNKIWLMTNPYVHCPPPTLPKCISILTMNSSNTHTQHIATTMHHHETASPQQYNTLRTQP